MAAMANRTKEDKHQSLKCPMCLDVFRNATLLSCGHTFCKECLEAYDELQDSIDHIRCPVCRKDTNLGEHRIAELTPNYLVYGLQDELQVETNGHSLDMCLSHTKVKKDIWCQVCKEFICLTCFINGHQGHKIKKKEELEAEMKDQKDALIQDSKVRKAEIRKEIANAKQNREDMDCHLSNLEMMIRDIAARKVTILQVNEEKLMEELDDIRKQSNMQEETCICQNKQLLVNINSSFTALMDNAGRYLDVGAFETHYLQCCDLEKALKTPIDEELSAGFRQALQIIQFLPLEDEGLDLGHIEVKGQYLDTVARVGAMAEELRFSRRAVLLPEAVGTSSLVIVRTVHLPGRMRGMAAVSPDGVAVGYGSYRKGADCFFVSGDTKQHLESEVGDVCDIALLTGGRSVVSKSNSSCFAFDTHGSHDTAMQFRCREGSLYLMLCSDQRDSIYAVNGNPEIYIFRGTYSHPRRIVPTGNTIPKQICVTKTGVMITNNCDVTTSTLTVHDREGRIVGSIEASDGKERLYSAVDSQDRVLVARVRCGSDVFRLTRYTLQGTSLIEQVAFRSQKLSNQVGFWCYMVSLSPNMLAFATGTHLYFIKLSA